MTSEETLPDTQSEASATVRAGKGTRDAPPRMRNAGYETFIILLSIFSLLNLVLIIFVRNEYARDVILIVDGVLCIVFLGDFLYRLFGAESKGHYFIRDGGWLDLLGSLPFPGLRLARVFRVVRVGHELHRYGIRRFWQDYRSERAGSTLLTVLFLIVVVVQYVSISVLAAERRSPDSNIHTASDAIWWSLVTISTVGYGDRYPVTNLGRVIGVFLLCSGVGLFSVVTGFLANAFVRAKEDTGAQTAASDQKFAELNARLTTIETLLRELQARGETPSLPEEQAKDRS